MSGPTVKRILVIDDDALTRKAYEAILAREGYQIALAANGREGLAQAAQFKPDLIMLDILMPEVDGISFLEQFQAKNHPETKVLVLSNSASEVRLKKAMNLGAREYLIKTEVKPNDIKAVVAGALASS